MKFGVILMTKSVYKIKILIRILRSSLTSFKILKKRE